jgi:hypothetical protein
MLDVQILVALNIVMENVRKMQNSLVGDIQAVHGIIPCVPKELPDLERCCE